MWGINLTPAAVPPASQLNFPATCIAAELESSLTEVQSFEPTALLRNILQGVLHWRGLVGKDIFIHAWESRLAFRGEQVEVWLDGQQSMAGQLVNLGMDGSLRLISPKNQLFSIQFGEVHLRPHV